MNTQQLHDLRLLWKQNPNKVVSKDTALAVLDELIMEKDPRTWSDPSFNTSSDEREGTVTALRVGKGRNTFDGNGCA